MKFQHVSPEIFERKIYDDTEFQRQNAFATDREKMLLIVPVEKKLKKFIALRKF